MKLQLLMSHATKQRDTAAAPCDEKRDVAAAAATIRAPPARYAPLMSSRSARCVDCRYLSPHTECANVARSDANAARSAAPICRRHDFRHWLAITPLMAIDIISRIFAAIILRPPPRRHTPLMPPCFR
jgi:hypothetical protein